MIKKLSDTYSYTPQEIKDKINEIIEQYNQLESAFNSREPIMKVVSYNNIYNWLNNMITDEELMERFFLARPIK